MSAKLDMALDDVVMTERTARRRGRGGRRVPNAARKATAPVGGIQKSTKPVKGALKPAVANGLAGGSGESKIIVSNLPTDVTEKNVKEYFSDTIGPVKRVQLTYGPNGVMRGIVTIVFSRPESATKALESLNGVQVDKRPMKIEVVLDATKAVAAVPSKGLSDRITRNKGPKPTTAAKPVTNGAGTRGSTRGRERGGRRGRNAGRAKPKTADELDAEMVDYFDTNAANGAGQGGDVATNGAVQPVANGGDDLGMDEISLAPPRLRARALVRPQNTFSLFRYLFPQTTKKARARLTAFQYESLPRYRHQAQSRIYQLILKRQAKVRQRKIIGRGFLNRLFTRRRVSRLEFANNAGITRLRTAIQKAMAQYGSDTESALGRGTRRKKLAGILKSANELRQSYTQSYGFGVQNEGSADSDTSGIPGAFPDVAIARSGDEEMILFPSYARRHTPGKSGHQNLPGTLYDRRERDVPDTSGYVKQEWDRYEEANSVVDVDVRGWVYTPHKGQISRYNRAMIALARRMSGIPAPSSPRASSPNSAHHLRVEARAKRHEQEMVDKEAESIVRKGIVEQDVAWQGGYSEAPSQHHNETSGSTPLASRTPSPRGSINGKAPHPLEKTSAYHEEHDDAPGPGSLAKRASWNHPSDMSSAELSIANAHMMLRLKPFLTTPLASTPLTVFFYNEKTSRSRTIYTNEAGHFNLRAALDFIPTHVRVLASDKLSATDEIHITEPRGVSLISDVDDTIKHSAIGAGAREVFRNVFIRDLGDLRIDGVKEWYTKMANMGVKLHYVSNMPWQLFPVLMSFLSGAGLPKGSFHLKHYTGMLQGIFEPVAERKKGTLERILSDFPRRRFILVGDSGEADLELYTELVQANPGRVLGVFIRDVTTTEPQGFFDSSINGDNSKKGPRSANASSSSTISSDYRSALKDFEERPTLPSRQQTRSASTLSTAASGPTMGKLIDIDDGEDITQVKRSMTDNELLETSRSTSMSSSPSLAPRPPSKPSILRSSTSTDIKPHSKGPIDERVHRKPAPPLPPKPRKLSASDTHHPAEPSPLARTQPLSQPQAKSPSTTITNNDGSRTPERYSYRASLRSKASSVYNSLPAFCPTDYTHQPPPSTSNTSRPLPDRSTTSTGSASTSSTSTSISSLLPPPPIPPRRNISSYPAAAAHYATNRFSGGFSGYNHSDGSSDGGPVRNKKEELWAQRWERAKAIMEEKGVVLRSWRVGTDVLGECVKLVEKAEREESSEREGDVMR
ncbi:MAG: hypothetical protein Q9209_007480 [Squamulea sp. 1 TL-2023]